MKVGKTFWPFWVFLFRTYFVAIVHSLHAPIDDSRFRGYISNFVGTDGDVVFVSVAVVTFCMQTDKHRRYSSQFRVISCLK